jgi:hypothetical protein
MTDATPPDAPAKPLRFRRLRIAASAFFALVALALCVLWVLSYWLNERMSMLDVYGFRSTAGTNLGWVYVYRGKPPELRTSVLIVSDGWRYNTGQPISLRDASWQTNARGGNVYWMPFSLLFALSAMPMFLAWRGLRFSLRTLLIVMTLLAVSLGIAIWAQR